MLYLVYTLLYSGTRAQGHVQGAETADDHVPDLGLEAGGGQGQEETVTVARSQRAVHNPKVGQGVPGILRRKRRALLNLPDTVQKGHGLRRRVLSHQQKGNHGLQSDCGPQRNRNTSMQMYHPSRRRRICLLLRTRNQTIENHQPVLASPVRDRHPGGVTLPEQLRSVRLRLWGT